MKHTFSRQWLLIAAVLSIPSGLRAQIFGETELPVGALALKVSEACPPPILKIAALRLHDPGFC